MLLLLLTACDGGGGPQNDTGGTTTEGVTSDVTSDMTSDTTGQPQVFTRPNVGKLDPGGPEIAALRKGVETMKSRPASDPTSWLYQANMHGTYDTPALQAWNSCQHGSYFFLSWHRMYLYYFERILRKASAIPTSPCRSGLHRSGPAGHPRPSAIRRGREIRSSWPSATTASTTAPSCPRPPPPSTRPCRSPTSARPPARR